MALSLSLSRFACAFGQAAFTTELRRIMGLQLHLPTNQTKTPIHLLNYKTFHLFLLYSILLQLIIMEIKQQQEGERIYIIIDMVWSHQISMLLTSSWNFCFCYISIPLVGYIYCTDKARKIVPLASYPTANLCCEDFIIFIK